MEWDFCLIFASLGATMSQKSSHPQAAKSVSRVLMSDTDAPPDAVVLNFAVIEAIAA